MKQVTFIKKSLYGAKGEVRNVTSAAAVQYEKLGLIEKEEKAKPETKEEKQTFETKEVKEAKAPKKTEKAKVTKAPKF